MSKLKLLRALLHIGFLFFIVLNCVQGLNAEELNSYSETTQDSLLLLALQSPIDEYGIPSEMYLYDDSLLVLKTNFETNKKKASKERRKLQAQLLGGGLLLIGIEMADESDLILLGGIPIVLLGVAGVVIGIYDIVDSLKLQSDNDEDAPKDNPLNKYFDIHYGKYLDSSEKG